MKMKASHMHLACWPKFVSETPMSLQVHMLLIRFQSHQDQDTSQLQIGREVSAGTVYPEERQEFPLPQGEVWDIPQ